MVCCKYFFQSCLSSFTVTKCQSTPQSTEDALPPTVLTIHLKLKSLCTISKYSHLPMIYTFAFILYNAKLYVKELLSNKFSNLLTVGVWFVYLYCELSAPSPAPCCLHPHVPCLDDNGLTSETVRQPQLNVWFL